MCDVVGDAGLKSDATIILRMTWMTWRDTASRSPIWDDKNMDELIDLHKHLIHYDFWLLKRGGVLVYPTCSLSWKQNEQVVSLFLDKCQDSFFIPASFSTRGESSHEISFIEVVPGTVRFNPKVYGAKDTHGSGDCLLPSQEAFFSWPRLEKDKVR